eukprot:TRINITY_DN34111_c0_g1_i1.p2 TRINITY_DN34111_c0_g1~~TRINITY_DN34111_c0_g1_i1.p2  ORF type:complete len:112 (-),score=9.79 TRINITY_DN34111_c0_g1_i1:30-365(-)
MKQKLINQQINKLFLQKQYINININFFSLFLFIYFIYLSHLSIYLSKFINLSYLFIFPNILFFFLLISLLPLFLYNLFLLFSFMKKNIKLIKQMLIQFQQSFFIAATVTFL